MLLPFTTLASAQTAAPLNSSHSTSIVTTAVNASVDPDIVVARLMTFDRNNDGRLVESELPERMQNLVVADVSGDRALDRAEIRAMATPRPVPAAAAATTPGFRAGGGGYTFGDQVSLSTRSHVEGALDDLRLPSSTHQRALAIVNPFMDRLEADASVVLLRELEGVMSPAQLGSFKVLFDRQMSGKVPVMRRPDGAKLTFFRMGPDLAQMINGFHLPLDRTAAALAALEDFKARIRPAGAERKALLDELKSVLSDEERENFGAALQRRPLVKAPELVAGVVSGVVPPVPRDMIEGPR
jgi:hypothetical protein